MLLTRATAIVAFLFYTESVILRLVASKGNDRRQMERSRRLWIAGSLILVAHVVCAFHFIHHWSHDHAFAATARQTASATGVATGAGLYLNYAFTLIWLADAAWWWWSRLGYENRARSIGWLVHGFMAFMWFNATVVFGHRLARWMGVACCVLLMAAAWTRRGAGWAANPTPLAKKHSPFAPVTLVAIFALILIILHVAGWFVELLEKHVLGKPWEIPFAFVICSFLLWLVRGRPRCRKPG